ncbi:MAG: hypothetical protein ACPG75_09920, partial [Alloalcanivorax venustensis]
MGTNQTLKTVLTASSEALVGLSENIPVLVSGITALGVAYGTKLLVPLAASTAAFVAQVPAMITASRTALAYATVMGGVSTAQLAATTATVGFTRALALLGGPAGAFAIAAGAAVLYFQSLETAAEKTARLKREGVGASDLLNLDSLRNVRGLLTVTGNKIDETTERLAEQRAEVARLNQEYIDQSRVAALAGARFTPPPPRALQEASAEAQRLEDNLVRLRAQYQDLERRNTAGTLAAIPDQRGDSDAVNEDLQKISEQLQRQVTLYGEVSEAAKLRFDIERGKFDGASPQQQEAALELAAQLDKKRAEEKAADQKKRDDEEAARLVEQNAKIVDLQQSRFDA